MYTCISLFPDLNLCFNKQTHDYLFRNVRCLLYRDPTKWRVQNESMPMV